MRGIGQKPIESHNPLYQGSEEKKTTKKPPQREPEKFPSIVPAKIMQPASIRTNFKSLTPRGTRTTNGPEIGTPSDHESPTGRLTKVYPQVGFPKLTPRSSERAQNFLVLPKHTNTAPIDEGDESSKNAPKGEPLTKQPDQVAAPLHFTTEELAFAARNKRVLPSAPSKDHAANPRIANLSVVVPVREKKELSGSENSWKARSDDIDIQGREQEHIDPTISDNPTEGLTKPNRSLFNKPVLSSPRPRVSTTSRRPVMGKKEYDKALEPPHLNADEIEKEEKMTEIEFAEVGREYPAEESGDLSAAEKKSALLKLHKKGRSVLPSTRATALQVTSSIGTMIRELNEPASASKAMRALNILYYVACEKSYIANESFHPEIELVAKHLSSSHLSPDDQFAFLRHLYSQVKEHLDSLHQIGVELVFGNMKIQDQFGKLHFGDLTQTLGYQLAAQAGEEAIVGGHW